MDPALNQPSLDGPGSAGSSVSLRPCPADRPSVRVPFAQAVIRSARDDRKPVRLAASGLPRESGEPRPDDPTGTEDAERRGAQARMRSGVGAGPPRGAQGWTPLAEAAGNAVECTAPERGLTHRKREPLPDARNGSPADVRTAIRHGGPGAGRSSFPWPGVRIGGLVPRHRPFRQRSPCVYPRASHM